MAVVHPLAKILDDAALGSFQISVMAICFSIAALDGFDTQSIAFVAPALLHEWEIPPSAFGPLFGIGLLGTLVGSVALGSAADRFGRKPLILLSTAVFGAMSLACATADSIETLGLYRFVAGLGLGGAIPNIIAMISEYAPKRVRATAIVAAFCGFPLGAVIGGIVSSRMIPALGWQSVFILGGVLPLLVLFIAAVWLPESIQHLAARGGRTEQIRRILSRIGASDSSSYSTEPDAGPIQTMQPVRSLFLHGRARWTFLLWFLTFVTLLLGYFLVSWTPLVLVDAGVPQQQAILGVVALNLGGIIGAILMGRIADKRSPFGVLAFFLGIGSLLIAAVGYMIQSSVPVLLGLILVTGFCIFGAQLNLTQISARYYPLYMRGTGIGWSMGLGRVGSILGPIIGGGLVAIGLARGQLFYVAAIPALVACLTVIAMSFNVPPIDGDS